MTVVNARNTCRKCVEKIDIFFGLELRVQFLPHE